MTKLCSILVSALCAMSLAPAPPTTTLSVLVQDALLGSPVADVTVYCAESKTFVTTGTDGYTAVFAVPYAQSPTCNVGTCTLVLLREGYLPCVCTVVTHPRQLRSGVTLSLYPDDGSTNEVTSIVEAFPQSELLRLVQDARSATRR